MEVGRGGEGGGEAVVVGIIALCDGCGLVIVNGLVRRESGRAQEKGLTCASSVNKPEKVGTLGTMHNATTITIMGNYLSAVLSLKSTHLTL